MKARRQVVDPITGAPVPMELGPDAAAKLIRAMNADELRALADRMEKAIEERGEECLTGTAVAAARTRLKTLRSWARDPSRVPEWSCVGSAETEGAACSFPAILEDIQRLENSCEVDYDPRWPIERADRACADGEDADRVGLIGKPCRISEEAKATPAPKMRMVRGKLMRG